MDRKENGDRSHHGWRQGQEKRIKTKEQEVRGVPEPKPANVHIMNTTTQAALSRWNKKKR